MECKFRHAHVIGLFLKCICDAEAINEERCNWTPQNYDQLCLNSFHSIWHSLNIDSYSQKIPEIHNINFLFNEPIFGTTIPLGNKIL